MFKVIKVALIALTVSTSAAKADLADIFIGIAGAVILNGVVKELTKDNVNPRGNTKTDNQRLWDAVTKIVPIYKDDNKGSCTSDPSRKLYGLYNPYANYMVICDGHSYNDFYETLRHEAMHLIQDCNTGLNNSGMKTTFTHEALLDVETQRTKNWLKSYKDVPWEVRMWESEAFHYEVLGSNEVLKLLNKRC